MGQLLYSFLEKEVIKSNDQPRSKIRKRYSWNDNLIDDKFLDMAEVFISEMDLREQPSIVSKISILTVTTVILFRFA